MSTLTPTEMGVLMAFNEARQAFLRETGEELRGIELGRMSHTALLGALRVPMKCNGTFDYLGVRVYLENPFRQPVKDGA